MFFSQNPFITSAEVYNDEDFFDREPVLHAVDKFIKRKNDYNFLIFGQRRIGKTSTLKRIHKVYNSDQNIVLYYNLQGDAETTLPVLLSKIKNLISNNLDIDCKECENLTESDFLLKFLPFLKQHLANKQLILLFDEFDVLGERENITALKQTYSFHKFVDFIPNIIEKIKDNSIPMKLIFAIGRNYKDLDNERFGQVTKFGQQVEVTFFSKEVVFQLLEQVSNGISFTTDAKEKLWQLSGGQPYFTQCLASYSYEIAEDEESEFITAEIVENSFLPTVKRYSSGVLWIWDTLIAVDKIILFLIAELTDNNSIVNVFSIKKIAEKYQLLPATKKLDATLTRLVNIKFLEEINTGQYAFKSDFFRKWVNTQINIQDLQKYFSNFDTEIKNLLTNARFYFNEEQNFTEALKYYEQVLKYDKSNSEAQFYAGKCYALKKFKTEKDFKTAFNLFKESFNPTELFKNDFIKEFLSEYYQKCKDEKFKNTEIIDFLTEIDPESSVLSKSKMPLYKEIEKKLNKQFENADFEKVEGLNWQSIKNEISNLTEYYITIEHFYSICKKHGIFKEEKILVLSQFFHENGVFLHYQNDKNLSQIIFLNKDKTLTAIHKIIDNQSITQKNGRFSKEDVINIWQGDDFQYVKSELIALMKQFLLIFEIGDSEKYIAPQKLSDYEPDYYWDKTENLQIRYIYKDFEQINIQWQLIPYFSENISNHNLVWKSGVVFEKERTSAKVISKNNEIIVKINGENKQEFLKLISNKIDEINSQYDNLRVEKLIPCNCKICSTTENPNFYEFSDLKRRLDRGKETVECKISYEDVDVKGLIDNIR